MAEHDSEIEVPPAHESPLRRAVADTSGRAYFAYATLEQARQDPDAALVSADIWVHGGSVRLTTLLSREGRRRPDWEASR